MTPIRYRVHYFAQGVERYTLPTINRAIANEDATHIRLHGGTDVRVVPFNESGPQS